MRIAGIHLLTGPPPPCQMALLIPYANSNLWFRSCFFLHKMKIELTSNFIKYFSVLKQYFYIISSRVLLTTHIPRLSCRSTPLSIHHMIEWRTPEQPTNPCTLQVSSRTSEPDLTQQTLLQFQTHPPSSHPISPSSFLHDFGTGAPPPPFPPPPPSKEPAKSAPGPSTTTTGKGGGEGGGGRIGPSSVARRQPRGEGGFALQTQPSLSLLEKFSLSLHQCVRWRGFFYETQGKEKSVEEK